MPPAPTDRRRRVRVANGVLRRIENQRTTLATRYGQAGTARDRFVLLADALRAASAPGAHQGEDIDAVERELDRINDTLRSAVDRMHSEQRKRAERVLELERTRRQRKGV